MAIKSAVKSAFKKVAKNGTKEASEIVDDVLIKTSRKAAKEVEDSTAKVINKELKKPKTTVKLAEDLDIDEAISHFRKYQQEADIKNYKNILDYYNNVQSEPKLNTSFFDESLKFHKEPIPAINMSERDFKLSSNRKKWAESLKKSKDNIIEKTSKDSKNSTTVKKGIKSEKGFIPLKETKISHTSNGFERQENPLSFQKKVVEDVDASIGNASAKDANLKARNFVYKAAAMGVGGGVVLNLFNNKGEQSNTQLYGGGM